MPKKILFINQETAPYVPDSVMACMGRELPERAQEAGYEIRTFMPKWGIINERRGQLHEVIRLSGINLTINDSDHPLLIKVASLPTSRVQVYFIDNEEFFGRRKQVLNDDGYPLPDSGERLIFFAKGVLETVKKLRWAPDVLVCQGWMSALIPLYVKVVYNEEPCLAETKVITSIHAEGFKGDLEDTFKPSIEYKEVTAETLKAYKETFDFAELSRLAIDNSDGVVVTSKGCSELKAYAKGKNVPIAECDKKNFVGPYKTFIEKILSDTR